MIIDGFEKAIIGIDQIANRIVYDKQKMIYILIKNGMEYNEANEYLNHNLWSAWLGEETPIYMDPITNNKLK
jgi:hypothetical protein